MKTVYVVVEEIWNPTKSPPLFLRPVRNIWATRKGADGYVREHPTERLFVEPWVVRKD